MYNHKLKDHKMSEIKGKIILKGETETFGANNFRKRLLVIETNEQYPQKIPVEFVQDKCNLIDNYQLNQNVTISINLKGNEYNGKYYVSLQGWKIQSN